MIANNICSVDDDSVRAVRPPVNPPAAVATSSTMPSRRLINSRPARAAVTALDTADTAVRKFAEPQPNVPADKLVLDKDTKAIAEHQYELAVATARDPLDKATIAFNDKRAALFAKRTKD